MMKSALIESRKLIGIQEAADYLGISKNTLYGWVNMKKIPYYKISRLLKFTLDDLNEWVTEQKVEAIKF